MLNYAIGRLAGILDVCGLYGARKALMGLPGKTGARLDGYDDAWDRHWKRGAND